MPIELKVPPVGESITEVQIGQWRKAEGERIAKDENLVEIESDKATVEVPAPVDGVLARLLKKTGETAAVGEVIGYLEELTPSDAAAAVAAQAQAAQSIQTMARPKEKPATDGSVKPASTAKETPSIKPATSVAAPAKKEAGQQVVRAVAPSTPETIPLGGRPGREEEIVPMSPIRRRIAQRLVEAQHTAALLTTFNEVNMAAVMTLRNQHKDVFQEKFGVKLGFMSFFVKAVIDALKQVPQINAEIRGNDIVYHNYFDIGIAVGGGKGLVVPILRDADRLSFGEIELTIADLAARARVNTLSLDELQGGTFTISNGGVYGSLLSTPIVNPPQSGILGLHAIQDRPIAENGQVVIRPMMYIALSYDHRIVDGQGAVTFLKRVKEVMESPLRMLVEI
jgi:2-oxoglutarate dehydrogenase E2 component (dihydrolipoamide succinyltransferase)